MKTRVYARLTEYCEWRNYRFTQVALALGKAGLFTWKDSRGKKTKWPRPTTLASKSGMLKPWTRNAEGQQWNIEALDYIMHNGVMPKSIYRPDFYDKIGEPFDENTGLRPRNTHPQSPAFSDCNPVRSGLPVHAG